MSERITPMDAAWTLVNAANNAWDEATMHVEGVEPDFSTFEKFVAMAGVVVNRECHNLFNHDSAQGSNDISSTCEDGARQNATRILEHLNDKTVAANLLKRHEIKRYLRNVFDTHGFVEVDTPILGSAITEYTTDNFAVRGNAGEFFLPQSPQIYKQAVVINTFPRYFQFARCFRDEAYESARTDQLHEFNQIDLELRCETVEDLRGIVEQIIAGLFKEFGKECPLPFPVLSYQDCMALYGTDKPDLRRDGQDNSFLWVVNFPQFVRNSDGRTVASHHPFQMPIIEDINDISSKTFELGSSTFDLVLNGIEIGGGDMRIHNYDIQKEVLKVLGLPSSQFAILLESLKDGKAPKHGGMAIGLERITMALTNSKKATDVTAFNL